MNSINIEQIAPNLTKVWFNGRGWIAFSYKTPIAFYANGELTIRQNDSQTTTGKHLNAIDADKSIRISGEEFENKLACYELRIEKVYAPNPAA